VAKAQLPTPETCAKCHEKRVKEYREGKHALAWAAMKAMPMITHQPSTVGGGDLKGCCGCHKVGEKDAKELKRYGSAGCDSCHTRHSFSVKEARDPRACRTCHMGFDHPQWDRMRAFQGAFHANPDYMHWYGWAKVKEAAARIKEEAARLRAEHQKKH
jgi:hypothetical protein